jgi:hypothetical protein
VAYIIYITIFGDAMVPSVTTKLWHLFHLIVNLCNTKDRDTDTILNLADKYKAKSVPSNWDLDWNHGFKIAWRKSSITKQQTTYNLCHTWSFSVTCKKFDKPKTEEIQEVTSKKWLTSSKTQTKSSETGKQPDIRCTWPWTNKKQ